MRLPSVAYLESVIYLFDFKFKGKTYDFPEDDFCLFKNFPHNKLVRPIISTKADLECSCTLLWLLKYKNIYTIDGVNPMETDSTRSCMQKSNFDQLVKECKFNTMLADCTDNDNDSDGFKVATIILSITTLLVIGLFIFTVYCFKFRRGDSNGPLSFSTFAASSSNKKIIISS